MAGGRGQAHRSGDGHPLGRGAVVGLYGEDNREKVTEQILRPIIDIYYTQFLSVCQYSICEHDKLFT